MSKIVLYSYSKCSTCQKALRFLEKIDIAERITIKEIKENPPSVRELEKMLKFQEGNLKKLFNTSGKLYREMQLTEKLKNMTVNDALKLLSQNGMLVKRPFLIGPDFGITGFNETKWEELLATKV